MLGNLDINIKIRNESVIRSNFREIIDIINNKGSNNEENNDEWMLIYLLVL